MFICHRTREVRAGVQRVFEYLADFHNLPEYFGQMPLSKAWFCVDQSGRCVRWGSQTSPYAGVLAPRRDHGSTIVDIEVHTEEAVDEEFCRTLDATLEHIADEVEVRSLRAAS
ncbi:hypothetical protein DMH04_30650 [Kibdelosporangium aridum]|uniref:Polyketide cyclase / dehydrase and lipid transport n=1 Tax=Kibdelosporangium aridum TaxID=2030 RepID=A0A428Z302_KIBAR|nr:hypothetical protein [Kibdelosporangium aridum]RSM80092.1 hypothetical protein DMH04_30650 [Kibdelosporangium aridum]